MPPTGSRKRPAPGTSPVIKREVEPAMGYNSTQATNNQILQWNQDSSNNGASKYPDPSETFSPNIYNTMALHTPTRETSNQLARRPIAQQVVGRSLYNGADDGNWSGIPEIAPQQPAENGWNPDDQGLAQKALVAKRDAQTKRKAIPLRAKAKQVGNSAMI